MVHEFKPHNRLCAASAEPAWDSLSLPLSPHQINKYTKKRGGELRSFSIKGEVVNYEDTFYILPNSISYGQHKIPEAPISQPDSFGFVFSSV